MFEYWSRGAREYRGLGSGAIYLKPGTKQGDPRGIYTATDHEGGGLVQIWQVKGGKFVKASDWFSAYPEVVARHIGQAAAKKS